MEYCQCYKVFCGPSERAISWIGKKLPHAKGQPDLFLRNSLHLGNSRDEKSGNIRVHGSYYSSLLLFSSLENMQENMRVSFLMVARLKVFLTLSGCVARYLNTPHLFVCSLLDAFYFLWKVAQKTPAHLRQPLRNLTSLVEFLLLEQHVDYL